MDALRASTVALALLMATPAQADAVLQWQPNVAEASIRFGIPVEWIERVMRAESGGMTMLKGRPIVSRAGAMGLMQLMPDTWSALRARLQLGNDPHDPRDNIIAGTAYLRMMYDRFGYPGLFAAYNAGPGRYAAYLAGTRTLPGETRTYLATITGGRLPPDPRPDQAVNPIFFPLQGNQAPAATSLFVTLDSGKKN
jgi:soluble lytic murein transglycosylase-like protein